MEQMQKEFNLKQHPPTPGHIMTPNKTQDHLSTHKQKEKTPPSPGSPLRVAPPLRSSEDVDEEMVTVSGFEEDKEILNKLLT